MNKRIAQKFINVLGASLLLCQITFGAIPNPDYYFQSFEEAFPNRPISDIKVDGQGFLWIATYGAGLYRFDGVTYESFNFEWQDSTSLVSNFIRAMHVDAHGQLWVGSVGGLSFYNRTKKNFQKVKLFLDGRPISDFHTVLLFGRDFNNKCST